MHSPHVHERNSKRSDLTDQKAPQKRAKPSVFHTIYFHSGRGLDTTQLHQDQKKWTTGRNVPAQEYYFNLHQAPRRDVASANQIKLSNHEPLCRNINTLGLFI